LVFPEDELYVFHWLTGVSIPRLCLIGDRFLCCTLYPRRVNPTNYSMHFDSHGHGQDHWITVLPFGLELVSWGSFFPGLHEHLFFQFYLEFSPLSLGHVVPCFPAFGLLVEMSLDPLNILKDHQSWESVTKLLERNGLPYSISKELKLNLGPWSISNS
jgi:hypothetical protein